MDKCASLNRKQLIRLIKVVQGSQLQPTWAEFLKVYRTKVKKRDPALHEVDTIKAYIVALITPWDTFKQQFIPALPEEVQQQQQEVASTDAFSGQNIPHNIKVIKAFIKWMLRVEKEKQIGATGAPPPRKRHYVVAMTRMRSLPLYLPSRQFYTKLADLKRKKTLKRKQKSMQYLKRRKAVAKRKLRLAKRKKLGLKGKKVNRPSAARRRLAKKASNAKKRTQSGRKGPTKKATKKAGKKAGKKANKKPAAAPAGTAGAALTVQASQPTDAADGPSHADSQHVEQAQLVTTQEADAQGMEIDVVGQEAHGGDDALDSGDSDDSDDSGDSEDGDDSEDSGDSDDSDDSEDGDDSEDSGDGEDANIREDGVDSDDSEDGEDGVDSEDGDDGDGADDGLDGDDEADDSDGDSSESSGSDSDFGSDDEYSDIEVDAVAGEGGGSDSDADASDSEASDVPDDDSSEDSDDLVAPEEEEEDIADAGLDGGSASDTDSEVEHEADVDADADVNLDSDGLSSSSSDSDSGSDSDSSSESDSDAETDLPVEDMQASSSDSDSGSDTDSSSESGSDMEAEKEEDSSSESGSDSGSESDLDLDSGSSSDSDSDAEQKAPDTETVAVTVAGSGPDAVTDAAGADDDAMSVSSGESTDLESYFDNNSDDEKKPKDNTQTAAQTGRRNLSQIDKYRIKRHFKRQYQQRFLSKFARKKGFKKRYFKKDMDRKKFFKNKFVKKKYFKKKYVKKWYFKKGQNGIQKKRFFKTKYIKKKYRKKYFKKGMRTFRKGLKKQYRRKFKKQFRKGFKKYIRKQIRKIPVKRLRLRTIKYRPRVDAWDLVHATRRHWRYPQLYESLPSHLPGWTRTKRRIVHRKLGLAPKPRLLAMDCEMVGTETDSSALASISVVDEKGKLLFHANVRPHGKVLDYRTEITGLTEESFKKGKVYTRSQARRIVTALLLQSWKKYRVPTILVGHSLNNDLLALRLDHQPIIDTGLLFAYDKLPGLTASLRDVYRVIFKKDLQARTTGVHDPAEDAYASLQLAMHEIGKERRTKYLPVPDFKAEKEDLAKLQIHSIQEGVKENYIMEMFQRMLITPGDDTNTNNKDNKKHKKGCLTQLPTFQDTPGIQGSRARLIFKHAGEANEAFKALNGTQDVDMVGRPQKEVRLRAGYTIKIRKMAGHNGAKFDLNALRKFRERMQAKKEKEREAAGAQGDASQPHRQHQKNPDHTQKAKQTTGGAAAAATTETAPSGGPTNVAGSQQGGEVLADIDLDAVMRGDGDLQELPMIAPQAATTTTAATANHRKPAAANERRGGDDGKAQRDGSQKEATGQQDNTTAQQQPAQRQDKQQQEKNKDTKEQDGGQPRESNRARGRGGGAAQRGRGAGRGRGDRDRDRSESGFRQGGRGGGRGGGGDRGGGRGAGRGAFGRDGGRGGFGRGGGRGGFGRGGGSGEFSREGITGPDARRVITRAMEFEDERTYTISKPRYKEGQYDAFASRAQLGVYDDVKSISRVKSTNRKYVEKFTGIKVRGNAIEEAQRLQKQKEQRQQQTKQRPQHGGKGRKIDGPSDERPAKKQAV